MEAGKSKKYTKDGILNTRGTNKCVVMILHVATGDEPSLVLCNGSGYITFELVFP